MTERKNKFYYSDGATSERRDETKVLHREDGPAMDWADGDQNWYFQGELHRKDGPAVVRRNGEKMWYLHGKRHRVDGPAASYYNGEKVWYFEGKELRLLLPKYVLKAYMKANNLIVAHLFTDPDPLVRKSASKYKWT